MSTQVGNIIYLCDNDCQFEGCPGHHLQVKLHNTSNVASVIIDQEDRLVVDFAALRTLQELLKDMDV